MSDDEKILIESITSPQHTERVNKAKYMAMRDALLAALPEKAPGLTVAEANIAILPHLSKVEFPGGAKAGWWLKAVQLDLEAKGIIQRGPGKPVRLFSVLDTSANTFGAIHSDYTNVCSWRFPRSGKDFPSTETVEGPTEGPATGGTITIGVNSATPWPAATDVRSVLNTASPRKTGIISHPGK
ncbi:hypothetical protein O3W52_31680 [Ensifer psoraleae]|uniref:Uncharacterized protein n=1 Tax=Sinorhizobium psoraleae TaxID=520838 RepID=A0ABT4KQM1_9HYPH|nr:hypothetical protein [Sinorhizobium psoraleae]